MRTWAKTVTDGSHFCPSVSSDCALGRRRTVQRPSRMEATCASVWSDCALAPHADLGKDRHGWKPLLPFGVERLPIGPQADCAKTVTDGSHLRFGVERLRIGAACGPGQRPSRMEANCASVWSDCALGRRRTAQR